VLQVNNTRISRLVEACSVVSPGQAANTCPSTVTVNGTVLTYKNTTTSTPTETSAECIEQTIPCGAPVTYSGSQGTRTYLIDVGNQLPNFNFTYDAQGMPDRFTVSTLGGSQLFTILGGTNSQCDCSDCTGPGMGNGMVSVARPTGVTQVVVTVNGYCAGTAWEFTVACAGEIQASLTFAGWVPGCVGLHSWARCMACLCIVRVIKTPRVRRK